MIELLQCNEVNEARKSSKGNQLKWKYQDDWYKADYTGYEGLSEYMISNLLLKSSMNKQDIVIYETEKIAYRKSIFLGCKSKNFLPAGWQLFTLERLFFNVFGQSLGRSIYGIENYEERLKFIVSQTERITGILNFGEYLSTVLTIDALFLNEDRHTHNIAVIMDEIGNYHTCPIFDNGAGLLSDTTIDYPLNETVFDLIKDVKPKTFCQSFDEQLDIAETIYGSTITFDFSKKDVETLLQNEVFYDEEIKNRVKQILFYQMDKYQYLFK